MVSATFMTPVALGAVSVVSLTLLGIIVFWALGRGPARPPRRRGPVQVLVAVGGDKGAAASTIAELLGAQLGPDTVAVWRRAAPNRPVSGRKEIDAVEAKMRARLASAPPELVLWGVVESDADSVVLRVLPLSEATASAATLTVGAPLTVGDGEGHPAAGEALAGVVLAALGQGAEAFGERAETVRAALEAAPSPALTGPERSRRREARAALLAADAEQSGQAADWLSALEAARLSVCDGRAATAPAEASAAQALTGRVALAAALAEEVPQERQASVLKEAVAAFQATLASQAALRSTADEASLRQGLARAVMQWRRVSLDAQTPSLAVLEEGAEAAQTAVRAWEALGREASATEARLLSAHLRAAAGERSGATSGFEAAVESYRDALAKTSRAADPSVWAAAHHGLAQALTSLGARRQGVDHLKQALEAVDAAQQVRTRADDAQGWAQSQSVRGRALTVIGERDGGADTLSSAVSALRGAAGAFEQAGALRSAADVRRALAHAERLLSERRALLRA